MSKYDNLGTFLAKQLSDEVPMTFAEIEQVTGVKLPPRAQHHRAWWSNNTSNNVMTKVWLDAGFRTERVEMSARKLVFKSTASVRKDIPHSRGMAETAQEFTMDKQAHQKVDKHPAFGALRGMMTIEPGYDIAASDPEIVAEWDDAIERKAASIEAGLKRKP